MKYLFALLLAGCSVAAPHLTVDGEAHAFAQRQVRYMAPFDLIQTLQQSFGPVQPYTMDRECTMLTDANRGLLGDSSAATGSPAFSEPSSNFVRWYVGCLGKYTQYMLGQVWADKEIAKKFWGETLTAQPTLKSTKFRDLDPKLQTQIVKEQIERLIGPSDVIADFGYFASSEELAIKIAADVATHDEPSEQSMRRILQAIALRDEYMSY